MRNKPREGKSYDFPNKSKTMDLSQEGEDPKPILISHDWDPAKEEKLVTTLQEYQDVFASTLFDLKGVDPDIF